MVIVISIGSAFVGHGSREKGKEREEGLGRGPPHVDGSGIDQCKRV